MATAHPALPRNHTAARTLPAHLAGASALTRLALLVVVLGAVWLGPAPLSAVPDVAPASAPAASFSAERAMRDVAALAARPRPVGSAEAAAARDYLLAQTSALGLKPELQRATVTTGGPIAAVTAVENVLVRLPGREGGRALLITGHYDSVPTSPGAGQPLPFVLMLLGLLLPLTDYLAGRRLTWLACSALGL